MILVVAVLAIFRAESQVSPRLKLLKIALVTITLRSR